MDRFDFLGSRNVESWETSLVCLCLRVSVFVGGNQEERHFGVPKRTINVEVQAFWVVLVSLLACLDDAHRTLLPFGGTCGLTSRGWRPVSWIRMQPSARGFSTSRATDGWSF